MKSGGREKSEVSCRAVAKSVLLKICHMITRCVSSGICVFVHKMTMYNEQSQVTKEARHDR